MKRHKRLRALAVAGVVSVSMAVGAAIGLAVPGAAARLAPKARATLAALRLWLHAWLHAVAVYVTTAHLIEAAAIAWLVFVLSLILLVRSRPNQAQVPRVDVSNATGTSTVTRQQQRALPPDMNRKLEDDGAR